MEVPGEHLTWPAWGTACRWVSSGAVPHRAVSSRREAGGTSRRPTQSGRRAGGTTLGPIETQTMASADVAPAVASRDKTGKRRGDRTGEALQRHWTLGLRLTFSRGGLIGSGAAWCRSTLGGLPGTKLANRRGGPLHPENRIDRGSKFSMIAHQRVMKGGAWTASLAGRVVVRDSLVARHPPPGPCTRPAGLCCCTL